MAIDRKEAVKIIAEHKRRFETLDRFLSLPNSHQSKVDELADALFEKVNPNHADENATCNEVIVNLDTKSNPQINELVIEASKLIAYNKLVSDINSCVDVNERYSTIVSINDWIKHLEEYVQTGALKRMFMSGDNKNKYIVDYEMLKSHLTNNYGVKVQSLISQIDTYANISEDAAWKNYQADFELYKETIANASDVIISRGDENYGLSDELVSELEKKDFSKEGLKCELRRYQEWGVKFALTQKNILLGDEMGLGKTIQAIAAMVALTASGEATHHIVVCPASVLTNWCREITKMSTLEPIKVHGADKMKRFEEWKTKGGVAVTTYETTGHFDLTDFNFGLLVVDEAHYIKNTSAQRTQNVIKISEHASYKLFMTGTALENKVEEMVALIKLLDKNEKGGLGKTALEAEKMLKIDLKAAVTNKSRLKAARKFQEVVMPVYFRRRRKDVLGELPELSVEEEWCDLLPEEEKIYKAAISNDKFTDARRVSWNIDDLTKSSKAIRLKELVELAEENGRKVIVFSFFLDTISKVMELLGDKCIGPINGSVPPAKRQEYVDQLNEAPAGSVLVAQIQSGGTGLNIQAASVIILCEPQLKPSIENQAISRAYRMGQTRDVIVYRLMCDDTIDERMYELVKAKQAQFDAYADESLSGNESIELDDSDVRDLFREEIERLKAKNGITDTPDTKAAPSDEEVTSDGAAPIT